MKLARYGYQVKETVKLAAPIALGQLGHLMMGVVDNIMVGRIGYTPLAAASLVNGLFFLIIVFGIGMTHASTPFIAMAKGAGKFGECGKILNHSLVVNTIFALILIAVTYGISFLIPHLNQPEEVVELAIPYLQILTASILPFLIFLGYKQFYEGLNLPNTPMVINLAANLLNAFLNWIFIYGKFGVPAMGLFGAGIATTATRWIMALTLIYYTKKQAYLRIYEPAYKIRPFDYPLAKKLIGIGLPGGAQYFLEVSAFSFATIMIGWIGTKELAAHQIALNFASISYLIILGVSSAGTVLVGNALGRNDSAEVRSAGFTAIALACSVMFLFALFFIIFRNQLPFLYNSNTDVVKIAGLLLIIAALFQVFDGMQATGIGVLRGITDVKIPLIISLFSYWIFGIPVSILLGFHFELGVYGIWIGLLLGLIFLGILLTVRFNYKTKKISVELS